MWFLKVLATLVLAAPLSVAGTIALGPLWTRIEEVHGIEAVGHAMYAGWCFATTYAVIAAIGLGLIAWPRSKSTSDSDN